MRRLAVLGRRIVRSLQARLCERLFTLLCLVIIAVGLLVASQLLTVDGFVIAVKTTTAIALILLAALLGHIIKENQEFKKRAQDWNPRGEDKDHV